MLTTCTRCHGLYEVAESAALAPDRACPRCAAIAELLATADAMHVRLQGELNKKNSPALERLVERAGTAIERVRATQ